MTDPSGEAWLDSLDAWVRHRGRNTRGPFGTTALWTPEVAVSNAPGRFRRSLAEELPSAADRIAGHRKPGVQVAHLKAL